MDFLDYDGVSITIKLTTLQCIVVLPNSHSIDKTTCDPACTKTVSDEDDSDDVRNLLCPKLSEELVGLTPSQLYQVLLQSLVFHKLG